MRIKESELTLQQPDIQPRENFDAEPEMWDTIQNALDKVFSTENNKRIFDDAGVTRYEKRDDGTNWTLCRDRQGTKIFAVDYGLNGEGRDQDYCLAWAELIIDIEDELRVYYPDAKVWIVNILKDCPDDVGTTVFGISVGENVDPKESVEWQESDGANPPETEEEALTSQYNKGIYTIDHFNAVVDEYAWRQLDPVEDTEEDSTTNTEETNNMELQESHAQGTCPICGQKIYSDEGCVKVAGVDGYVHDYHCTDESLEAYYNFADKFWATHDSTGMSYYSNAKLFDAKAPKCKLRESKKLKEAVMTAEEADFHEGDYYKNRFGWVIVIEKIDGDYVQAKQYLDTNPDEVTTRMKSIPTLYDHLVNCHFTKLKNIKESKELKEEEDLVRYATLSSLLRKAKNQKVKQTGDHYATVTVKGYAGGPYELNIDYCNSDEGMTPLFYVSFAREAEDDDDFCIGESLYGAIKEKFKSAGYLEEMQAEGLNVEAAEIQRLEDIANGQGFLFDEECCSAEFQRMAPTNAMHLFGPNAKIHKKDSLGKKNKYNKLGESQPKIAYSKHTMRVPVDTSVHYETPYPEDALWISPTGLFFVRKMNDACYFLYDDPAKSEIADFPTLEDAKEEALRIEREGSEVELNPWEDPMNYLDQEEYKQFLKDHPDEY